MTNETSCACGCSNNSTETLTITDAPTEHTMNQNNLTLNIDGMTCAHCVSSVTEELSEIPGVSNVTVELNAGGTSVATVTTNAPVDDKVLEAAVIEAGYAVADPSV